MDISETRNTPLIIGGWLSVVAALLHIACIFGGPEWYLFFGAGEQMAQMAAAGDPYPTIVTLVISAILFGWALYAWSGAGVIIKLPLLRTCMVLITAVYLVRGAAGLIVPHLTEHPAIHHNSMTFWMVSSTICCVYGIFYLTGTLRLLRQRQLSSS